MPLLSNLEDQKRFHNSPTTNLATKLTTRRVINFIIKFAVATDFEEEESHSWKTNPRDRP